MIAKPWARATAVMPLRPAPPPMTAAAPAPMNTKEKVPMNSARSLGAIRLGIVISRDRIDLPEQSDLRKENTALIADWPTARERRGGRNLDCALLCGDRLRFEIDAQRLRDAGAVFGIGAVEVN